jgi:hypothetical protein
LGTDLDDSYIYDDHWVIRMVSSKVILGLAIIGIGTIIGFLGAATPVKTISTQKVGLVNTPISVAANDYATQSLEMTKGETVSVSLSIVNQTIFTFDIFNQSQYYIYYDCAPTCAQPLVGGNGSFAQQAGESSPYQLNVTITPSTPYSGEFTAPSNGTYYFFFDNTIGPNWTSYINQDASGQTDGRFSLSNITVANVSSVNWGILGIGSSLTLVGGIASTVLWDSKSKPEG